MVSKYPEFSTVPNKVLWMMVFSAVMESGTHSKEVVNEARTRRGKDRWDLFTELDYKFEEIASGGHERLQRSVGR